MAMHEFPPLLPDEVIERAKKLNPALLADVNCAPSSRQRNN